MSQQKDQQQAPNSGVGVDAIVSWDVPREITDIKMAFPSNVIGEYLPQKEEIPRDFWEYSNKYNRLAANLFFKGGDPGKFKKGINRGLAIRHLQTCLSSFEPEHEHKQAGVGYLLSLWLDS